MPTRHKSRLAVVALAPILLTLALGRGACVAGDSTSGQQVLAPSNGSNGGPVPAALQQLLNSRPGALALQMTGLNPLAQSVKYLMPNVYQGAQTDLANGYYAMSDGATKGVNGLTSAFGAMGDNLMSRYHSMQAGLVESLQQQVARQDVLLKQMYEMVANPEQLCRDLAKQSKDSAQQAQQLAQQAQEQSSSFMNKWMGK